MSLLIAALLAQAAPAPAAGPQWERLGEDEQIITSLDPARISRSGNLVEIVVRVEVKTVQANGLHVLITYSQVDCAGRSTTPHRMEGYRADGSLLRAFDLPAEMRRPIPISRAAVDIALLTRSCGTQG